MRISTFFADSKTRRRLERRLGGGGGGGGGRGGGGGGGGGGRGSSGGSSGGRSGGSSGRGGGSSGSSGSGTGSSGGGSGSSGSGSGGGGVGGRPIPLGGPGGFGGGPRTTIPAGQPFAGRTQGGGTRNDVYGTSTYGSGYPVGYPGTSSGRGVAGKGLPFYFWPVVWGGVAGGASGAYLRSDDEYGNAQNASRPGGPLLEAPFLSKTQNTTLRVISDHATTTSLIQSIASACRKNLNTTTTQGTQFDPNAPNAPRPEQAIQYYRASSVVLTLEGYNNTAALSNDTNAPPISLPSWVDRGLLDCVNSTIGSEVPLVDASGTSTSTSTSSGAFATSREADVIGHFALILCLLTVLHVL